MLRSSPGDTPPAIPDALFTACETAGGVTGPGSTSSVTGTLIDPPGD
jgi:hypothetical protein